MTETDPRAKNMRHYTPGRRPYVEVREGESRYHAQVIGWSGDHVFIEYPPKVRAAMNPPGQQVVKWVPVSSAVRIRRADSIWATTEDDHQWHTEADKNIEYRADPWTVYRQEHPNQ